ncbi:MAG: preprotein translocase subunit SecG [Pseudomonadota bacterium]
MSTVVLVVHLIIAISLVAIILLQRSEGGALSGLGGGGGNFGGLMSGRGTANLLTRTTAILATCFIGTSLFLAILAGNTRSGGSILDAPAPSQVEEPAEPAGPSAPVAN